MHYKTFASGINFSGRNFILNLQAGFLKHLFIMKNNIITSLILTISLVSFSQTWEENAYKENKNANFFDLKKSFDDYRNDIPYSKGNGYKPYVEKMDFLEPRVDEDGYFPSNSFCGMNG